MSSCFPIQRIGFALTTILGNCARLISQAILTGFLTFVLLSFIYSEANAQNNVTISDMPDATLFSGNTMGPIKYRVTLAKTPGQIFFDTESTRELAAAIENELATVNQLMSTYIPDSDVSRFNQTESTEWIEVSEPTAEVVKRALEISQQTDGAFDITVAPLVNLWNFGPDKHESRVPAQNEIEQIREIVGFDKLQVRLSPPSILKTNAKTQIDLSAIAKGFAVDQLADLLRARKYNDFFIEIGGEVATSGKKKDGSEWTVGILHPSPLVQSARVRVPLEGKAMATSGDYQNFFQIGDETYSHTIDPRTGWPVKHQLASVSIITNDCMTADALATAVNVMGDKIGKRFCDDNQIDYYLMVRTESGKLAELSSVTFPIAGPKKNDQGFSGIYVATLAVFLLVVVAMAVGVIFGKKRIQGSCGGIASLNSGSLSPECSMCSQPSDECSDLREAIRKKNATAKNPE